MTEQNDSAEEQRSAAKVYFLFPAQHVTRITVQSDICVKNRTECGRRKGSFVKLKNLVSPIRQKSRRRVGLKFGEHRIAEVTGSVTPH